MASNTKLTKDTKNNLKSDLNDLSKDVYSWTFLYDSENGVTVLMVRPFKGSNVVHLATSVMSPDEIKFRPSVGRYFAFHNYIDGKYINSLARIHLNVFENL